MLQPRHACSGVLQNVLIVAVAHRNIVVAIGEGQGAVVGLSCLRPRVSILDLDLVSVFDLDLDSVFDLYLAVGAWFGSWAARCGDVATSLRWRRFHFPRSSSDVQTSAVKPSIVGAVINKRFT